MKKTMLMVSLLGLMVFVAGCSLTNNQTTNQNANKAAAVNQNVNQAKNQNLNQSLNQNTNQQAVTNQPQEAVWNSYTYVEFNFDYPSNWTPSTQGLTGDNKVEFLDSNNKRMALLTCPIVVTGYENSKVSENKKREFTKEGNDFKIELSVLEGLTDESGYEVPNVGLLLMRRGEFNSCQLFSRSDWSDWGVDSLGELSDVYNEIYKSVN